MYQAALILMFLGSAALMGQRAVAPPNAQGFQSNQLEFQRASLAISEGKYKIAEEILNKIYDETQDPMAILGLSELYITQGDSARSIKLLEGELARNPDRVEYLVGLGNIHARLQKYKESVDYFQKAAKLRPAADIYVRLAEAQRRLGDLPGAKLSMQEGLKSDKSNANLTFAYGVMLDTEGEKDEARSLYEQCLKLQPDHFGAINNLAYLLADTGTDLDRALALARQAREKAPNEPNVGDTLGYVLLRRKQTDDALILFRMLLRQAPTNAVIRYHMALALLDKGDKYQAQAELESALRFANDPKDIANIKQSLDTLTKK